MHYPRSASLFRAVQACTLASLLLGPAVIGRPVRAAQIDADILLRGGTIHDGSGSQSVVGDVAIRGERIVAVGRFEAKKPGRVVDCAGLVVAPGFIDLHTHSDSAINQPEARRNLNYLRQGCTTVVTGNCGGGPADVGKFLASVDRLGFGTNVIHLVPHGSLRRSVMGGAKRTPTPDELERMKQKIDQAMRDGAWGMSTGLIYAPSLYAEPAEIVALAKVVAAHGGIYASHIRNEGNRLLDAVREAIDVARQARLPVEISHFKSSGKANWGRIRDAARLIEEARREGLAVTADQYPYTASSTSLLSTLISAAAIPGGIDKLFERTKSDAPLESLVRRQVSRRFTTGSKIVVATCKKHPEYAGKTIPEIATQQKLDPVDLAMRLLSEGEVQVVNFGMSEDDVRYAMTLPWVATGSDGGARVPKPDEKPHPRNFGTFPRKMGFYALREKVIPLAQAIRSCTGLAADILGLADRGYLRPGAYADVVVFDPKEFVDRATFDEPQQYAPGVRYLLLAGHLAIDDGKPSEKLFGRAIRHPEPDPSRPATKKEPAVTEKTPAIGKGDWLRVPEVPVPFSGPERPADIVLTGGKLVTMDDLRPLATALAARGDRIIAVGDDAVVRPLVGKTTRVIQLKGRLVLPGFIEGHGHFLDLGESKRSLDLTRAQDWEEIVALVAEAARKAPAGTWIVGHGWHQSHWDKPPVPNVEGYPDHEKLSRETPNHPVLLTHGTGHMCLANAKAMELAGVDGKTPDPPGGQILRDRQGRAIGAFRETAAGLIQRAYGRSRAGRTPAEIERERDEEIRLATADCLAKGVTTFHDAGEPLAVIDHFHRLAERGELKVRLWVMIGAVPRRLGPAAAGVPADRRRGQSLDGPGDQGVHGRGSGDAWRVAAGAV